MSYAIDKQIGGEIFINSNFNEDIVLTTVGQEVILQIDDVSQLISLNKFTSTFTGTNETTVLKVSYRIAISSDPDRWSEWYDIPLNGETNCFIELSSFYDYNIEVKFTRSGKNDTGQINVKNFVWEGVWDVNNIEEPILDLTPDISPVILDSPDVYKVFRLDGYELVAKNFSDLNVDYRISQDDKRSWTQWTILTNENITTEKIDDIRFFNIQYKFEHIGDSGTIQIRDLNLYGEFINVTQNYNTSNLVGLREDCKNGLAGNSGLNGGTGSNNLSMGSNTKNEESIWSTLDQNDTGNLYNPYNLGGAVDLYTKLSDDATQIGGWSVEYYKTSPDENGIDHSIHEYSLYNVIKTGDIKILVPDNQFPNNQIAFNQFDLALLESFEVHLTKEEFKRVFGAQYRPAKEDFLYFCDISKMFRVQNSQAIRDFGNSSVYYKLILTKYNKRANVKAEQGSVIQEQIDDILKNSTLEDLFATEKENDQKEVAYKKQHETLTNDFIRDEIKAKVEKDLLDNAELVLSKYHYNLSGISPDNEAVTYQSSDTYLKEGENRSFMAWFKLLDYADSDSYSLLNNYSDDLEKGYKFDITNNEMVTTINGASYSLPLEDNLVDDVWYCVLINIDQRQRKIYHNLYKRNVDREIEAKNLKSTKLKLLISNELDYTPNYFQVEENDIKMKINGSAMRITNLRIFNDIIEDSEVTKIVNQQIVRDTDKVILADNSNKVYVLPRYTYYGSRKNQD